MKKSSIENWSGYFERKRSDNVGGGIEGKSWFWSLLVYWKSVVYVFLGFLGVCILFSDKNSKNLVDGRKMEIFGWWKEVKKGLK